jgi:hypothetical protein
VGDDMRDYLQSFVPPAIDVTTDDATVAEDITEEVSKMTVHVQ